MLRVKEPSPWGCAPAHEDRGHEGPGADRGASSAEDTCRPRPGARFRGLSEAMITSPRPACAMSGRQKREAGDGGRYDREGATGPPPGASSEAVLEERTVRGWTVGPSPI